jgi:hypothetical protein
MTPVIPTGVVLEEALKNALVDSPQAQGEVVATPNKGNQRVFK